MKKFSYILSEILDFLGYHFTNRPPTPLASQAMCQRGGVTLKPFKTIHEKIAIQTFNLLSNLWKSHRFANLTIGATYE